jgi:hypothetical protein
LNNVGFPVRIVRHVNRLFNVVASTVAANARWKNGMLAAWSPSQPRTPNSCEQEGPPLVDKADSKVLHKTKWLVRTLLIPMYSNELCSPGLNRCAAPENAKDLIRLVTGDKV